MQLLLVRHGIAEDREKFAATGEDDSRRPLTKQGKWKMEQIAQGLRRVARSIDVLATSPLTRARQTAEIIASAYGDLDIVSVPALAPDSPFDRFLTWLRRQRDAEIVAVVGHEPHIGGLATWLLTGLTDSRTPLRKGGACLLELEPAARAGEATLVAMLPPALLRRLGD